VITSMAGVTDELGLLNRFMKHDKKGMEELKKAGWKGDVQYRPFSEKGPIMVNSGIRALTIFEIADIVDLASRPDKRVILVCGPSGQSQESKAYALKCLLEQPSLRVWTHVVTDVTTARQVLALG